MRATLNRVAALLTTLGSVIALALAGGAGLNGW